MLSLLSFYERKVNFFIDYMYNKFQYFTEVFLQINGENISEEYSITDLKNDYQRNTNIFVGRLLIFMRYIIHTIEFFNFSYIQSIYGYKDRILKNLIPKYLAPSVIGYCQHFGLKLGMIYGIFCMSGFLRISRISRNPSNPKNPKKF